MYKEKEKIYKQIINNYSFVILLIILEKFEEQEKFTECEYIIQFIKNHNQKNKTNIPLKFNKDLIDIYKKQTYKQHLLKEEIVEIMYNDACSLKEKIESNINIKEIKLSSYGLLYPNKQNVAIIKSISIIEAADILYDAKLIKNGTVLIALLKECLIDAGGLGVDDMLCGDRNQLLLEIRKTIIGFDYVLDEKKCCLCNKNHKPIVNLENLKIKYISQNPDEQGCFNISLTNNKVKFKFLTGRDILSLKNDKVSEKMKKQIVEVDGNNDFKYICDFVKKMSHLDFLHFNNYINKIECGIETNVEITCENCKKTYNDEIVLEPIKLFYSDDNIIK